jgi:single-strand DNA-binding protein
MANLNRIILVGKLTSDADSKFTVEGLPMSKMQLAVNRYLKDGVPQGTDFIDVIAWGKLAQTVNDSLKKGKVILVEGRIQVRSYQDQGGQRKWVTEVIARSIQGLSGEAEAWTKAPKEGSSSEDIPAPADESFEAEDSLPF